MLNVKQLDVVSGVRPQTKPLVGTDDDRKIYDHPHQFFGGILPDAIIDRVNGTSYKKIEELAEQRQYLLSLYWSSTLGYLHYPVF